MLPNPGEVFFNTLKKMFNKFIWGGSVNKIAYKRMVVNRREGGMGVIDIKQFWAVLKVGWFK